MVSNHTGCISLKKQNLLVADGFDPSLSFLGDFHPQSKKKRGGGKGGVARFLYRGGSVTKASIMSASNRSHHPKQGILQ